MSMSLASTPDLSVRLQDKTLEMMLMSGEEPVNNAFNEFFECELYNIGMEESDHSQESLAIIEAYLNEKPDYQCDPAHGTTASATTHESSPQPWRKGLWCLPSELNVDKTRTARSQLCVSPTHLLTREARTHETRKLQASTSFTEHETKKDRSPMSKSRSTTHDRSWRAPRPLVREQTLSPTPMYAHCSTTGSELDPGGETWQQSFRDFHLQSYDDHAYTNQRTDVQTNPMLDANIAQQNRRVKQINATVGSHDRGFVAPPGAHPPNSARSPTRYHYPFQQLNGPASGVPGVHKPGLQGPLVDVNRVKSETNVKAQQHYGSSFDQDAVHAWTSGSIHSSENSCYSHCSKHSYEAPIAPYSQNLTLESWIPPSDAPVMRINPSSRDMFNSGSGHEDLVAPMPQRAPHHVLHAQYEISQTGLGIHYPAADEIGRAVPYEPVENCRVQSQIVTSIDSHAFATYPPLPPPPSETRLTPDDYGFIQSDRRYHSVSRTPSPIASPNNRRTPRSLHQRSPSRPEQTQHGRRKSIHKSGPMKDVSTSSNNRRSRSTSKPPRTPRTPKASSSTDAASHGAGGGGGGGGGGDNNAASNFGSIDFVNFTPKDSAKLMSDVAPSGSSKTRARREQEARERRKRISDAAFLAVRRVGGDIRALEEVMRT